MSITRTCAALAFGAVIFGTTALVSEDASAQSLHQRCDAYAYDVAQSRGKGRVGIGGLVGGATGAIIGGIAGGGKGAAIGAGAGAAAGAVGGAASKKIRRGRVYRDAYNACIAENS